jgi:ABC-type uncharacterized transport system fused permease/ATPase subunit
LGEQRWAAGGLLALLVLLLLGRTEFNVLFNQQTGEFTSALAAKDSPRFWRAMQVFGLGLLAAVPLSHVIGDRGRAVFTKIMALLLGAIGIQFIINGLVLLLAASVDAISRRRAAATGR